MLLSEHTKEPGVTKGGACCNAMLKALYDSEQSVGNMMKLIDDKDLFLDDENLFQDDNEERSSYSAKSLESLLLGDISTNPSDLTWSQILRKMKDEINTMGFSQIPIITSSRKFDLNQPISFIGDNFDMERNRKRSLFIGCNYDDVTTNNDIKLNGSHDDIRSMKDYMVNVHGFPESEDDMSILLDDNEGHEKPTYENMIKAFNDLAAKSQPGDAVFIQFSGHGGRILDTNLDSGNECYDEVFAPVDVMNKGLIRDTLIFKSVLAPMKDGITVTILLDCCDTGGLLDLPYSWSTENDKQQDISPKVSLYYNIYLHNTFDNKMLPVYYKYIISLLPFLLRAQVIFE